MNGTSPLGFIGICLAFAVTAFLGGMAGSLLLGDDDGGGASASLSPTQVAGTPRPGGTAAPGAAVVSPTLPPAAVATATPPATATPATATYTVVSGDTLTGIAIKQNVPVAQRPAWIQQVRTLNNLTGDAISVGQVLKLPPATAGAPTAAPGGPTATRPAGSAPNPSTASQPTVSAAPTQATGCATFSNQKVRDWCNNPAGDVLNCSDFSGTAEATRFTKTHDTRDVNKLDQNANGQSCE